MAGDPSAGTSSLQVELIGWALSTHRRGAAHVVDDDKGTIELKATNLEFGDYAKGDVPTLLDVTIGAPRRRDVPVLRSGGKKAGY